MPDFPTTQVAPRRVTNSYSIDLLAAGGDAAGVQLTDIATTVAGAELALVRTSVGNISNAAVRNTSFTEKVAVSDTNINPLDEAFADASTKLVLVFQDDDMELRTIAIPAPDASFFGTDGVSLIPADGGAAAGTPARILADALAIITLVMNGGALADPAGTFSFLKGYRSRRTSRLPRPRTSRPVVEPSGGVLPPAEPGL
jgi:hypothetical protein